MTRADRDVRRLALEAAGITVVVWDLGTDALHWTDGGAALGLDPAALPDSASGVLPLVDPADRPKLADIGRLLRAGSDVPPFDLRVVTRGRRRWVRATTRRLDGPHDAAGRIIVAAIDATAEHLRVDRAARDAELDAAVAAAVLRFVGVEPLAVDRQLGAALSDVAHLLDAPEVLLLRRIGAPPGWEQRSRWPGPGEPRRVLDVPVAVLDALDRGDPVVLRAVTATGSDWLAAPSGTEADAFALAVRAAGDTDWVDADGDRLSVLATACQQAVQRSTMAHQLEQTVATVDQLVATGPIILWRGTTDRSALDTVSANTQRTMGYPPEVFARRWFDLVHPEDVTSVRDTLRAATRSGRGTYVARLQHADGGFRAWQVTLEVGGEHGERDRPVRGYSLDVSAWMGAIPASEPTILLVEDDPQVREVVATALRADGYAVRVAADVAEARAVAAEASQLDLILSDLTLPDASGTQLLDELRETRPAVPAVLMSGHPVAGLAAGVELLPKPFTLEQLRTSVERQLGSTSRA